MSFTPTPPIQGYASYLAANFMADSPETPEPLERTTALWDTTVERFPQPPALYCLKSLDDLDEEADEDDDEEDEDVDLDDEEDEEDLDEDYDEDEDEDEDDEDEDDEDEEDDGGVKPLKMA